MPNCRFNRIVVAGSSGSGKTTIAKRIATEFDIPYIDVDAIHWLPNWVQRPPEEKVSMVQAVVEQDRWVMDGFSSIFKSSIEPRMELLLWPRISLPKCLGRIILRSYRRSKSKELVCNGNVENLINTIIGKDALIPFTIRTYLAKARTLEKLVNENPSKAFIVKDANEAISLIRHSWGSTSEV